MKKILLFLLFLIFSTNTFAQLDREHWFAPMIDRTSNPDQYQTVYMSTNETTPFKVDIYNNNVVIGSVTISKNNPGKYNVPRTYIITTNTGDAFRSVSKGIYLKGERPFYSSLRFSILNHGELVTSKGTAGIGTSFRAVMAPMTANNNILNFMTSVMATEDNTSVTITGFNSSVIFSDGVGRTQFTFTLNKGQSYIIDGRGGATQNWTGFIGAKIDSDKPISITNGNFNGQYATNSTNSSDILMDQGVPIDKLGQEFVLMKGNGNLSVGMEKAIIVATENNTQIYLNGSGTPAATINAGGYYITPNNAYILQGSTHYNMHIKTTKNAYVYQLLAGDPNSSELATGGFNYIPPLSCYLPKKIDEIGLIQENYVVSNGNPGGRLDIPTKLNIITEKGATIDVKRNGVSLTLTSANGPFNVTGSNSWVTYSYPNITGNVAVISSSAVTAGISAGDDAVGYGGYFAGFSFIPAIIKQEGDCLPGVKLAVTEGFSSYQWVIKDNTGAYVPAPGVNNTNTYEPAQAGIYAVIIQQGSCPAIQTQDFKFYNCTTYTNVNYETCSTIAITPTFSLSTQTLNPTTVKIETPPTKGTVVIGTNGVITYTANPNTSGIDTFKFSYCGNNAIPDCETAQATILVDQVVGQDVILRECTYTTSAVYDLSKANVTADNTATRVYYNTLLGAQNETLGDEITGFTAFNSPDTNVYVRIKNAKNCFAIYKIELKHKAFPVVQENLYTKAHCDEEDGLIDGNYVVNPNNITPIVLANPTTFTVKYYDSLVKADGGGTDNITGNYVFTPANAKIWIRVESADACVTVKEITLNIGAKLPLLTNNISEDVCDKGFDNTETVDLSTYLPKFTSQTGLTATYYANMPDALSGLNAIPALQTVVMGTVGTFYYVIKNANFCSDVATINLTLIMGGQASTTLPANVTICDGSTTILDAGTAHAGFKWYNENDPTTIIGTTSKMTLPVGKYFVVLISANGCEYKQFVEVIGSPKAVLNIAAYNATLCDNDLDGKVDVVFSTDVTPVILANSASFTVNYYSNAAMTALLADNFSFTADTRVYVKVSSTYCADVTGFIDFKIGNKVPLLTTSAPQTICDVDYSGDENIDLNDYKNLFLSAANMGILPKFYLTLDEANKDINAIGANVVLTTPTISYYYRFETTGSCPNVGELKIKFTKGFASATLPASITICENATTQLDAGTAHTSYKWYNDVAPTTIIGTNAKITVTPGKYFVILTSSEGCDYQQNVEVIGSPIAQLDVTKLNSTYCDDDLDGKINLTFSTDVTPVILLNNGSTFTVSYYSNVTMTALLPDAWGFTADTRVYVKVSSTYCTDVTGFIDFKIGNKVPLLTTSAPQTICDVDYSGDENIDLNDYKNLFLSAANMGILPKFYLTLDEANKDINAIGANVVLTTPTISYYYRFETTGSCPNVGELKIKFTKGFASTTLPASITICENATTQLDAGTAHTSYKWYNDVAPTTIIGTNAKITVTPGKYFVILTSSDGCDYQQNVEVVGSPVAQLDVTKLPATYCDEDLDGAIKIKFSTDVTPLILLNNNSVFVVKYYNNATGQLLPDNWSFTTDITVKVEVTSVYCGTVTGILNFKIGAKIPLIKAQETIEVCDDDLDGKKLVQNLDDYKTLFTTDPTVTVKFYIKKADAQANASNNITEVTVNKTQILYVRLSSATLCSSLAELTIKIKVPLSAKDLEPVYPICPDATWTLDAGLGFSSYAWYDESDPTTIIGTSHIIPDLPVGKYFVVLTGFYPNDCPYTQKVEIKAVELPTIESIVITGSTVVINAKGGKAPYRYALDNGSYQDSNTFTNVAPGLHTAYVISADDCTPVSKPFSVIEIYNLISPNGDGVNDVLDMSLLQYKINVKFQVYDREGRLLFDGDNKNNYIWDGKQNGKVLPTSSYWYIMQWQDFAESPPVKYTGWVLLKNRNSD